MYINPSDLLKQFKIHRGLLYHIRGPNKNKPAGHRRKNGQVFVIFHGTTYKHDDLLFLYTQQLKERTFLNINTSCPQDYTTVSGHLVQFYTREWTQNAMPFNIHGAIKIHGLWHACQWSEKGIAAESHFNLTEKP